MGVSVGGHRAKNFSHRPKDEQENSTSFDTHDIPAAERGKTLIRKKLVKNTILRALKLRGLT